MLGNYVTPVPAQQRLGPHWFAGSADAIYQSLNLVYDERPGVRRRLRRGPRVPDGPDADAGPAHRVGRRSDGGRHCGCRTRPSDQFGVITTKDGRTIEAFLEKPTDPPGLPDDPDSRAGLDGQLRVHDRRAARRGEARRLRRGLRTTTWAATSSRRWSRPARRRSTTSPTTSCPAPPSATRGYWRDVGTLDAYHEAHMDLVSVHPVFNLYNQRWPILTTTDARCRRRSSSTASRAGPAARSSRWSRRAASSPAARCAGRCSRPASTSTRPPTSRTACCSTAWTYGGVRCCGGRSSTRACVVPPGCPIGVDHEHDRARGFHVSDGGVVVIGKGQHVPAD